MSTDRNISYYVYEQKRDQLIKNEAHRPRFAYQCMSADAMRHSSSIATANRIQIWLSREKAKDQPKIILWTFIHLPRFSLKTFLVLEKNSVFVCVCVCVCVFYHISHPGIGQLVHRRCTIKGCLPVPVDLLTCVNNFPECWSPHTHT